MHDLFNYHNGMTNNFDIVDNYKHRMCLIQQLIMHIFFIKKNCKDAYVKL